MKYKAYWLHENGEVVPVATIHIAEVIKAPERFSYTRQRIEEDYALYNEPVGFEGKAREKIMVDLIKNYGWIRLRFNPAKDLWVVELHSLTDELKETIRRFFKQPEVIGNHLNADVRITELFKTDGMMKHHSKPLNQLFQSEENEKDRSFFFPHLMRVAERSVIEQQTKSKVIHHQHEHKIQNTTVIDGDKVTIFVDGVEVQGRTIFRCGSDIHIQIEKPYQNISGTGSHIPYFARNVHSYNGTYGDYTAEKILSELYSIGKYMTENLEMIRNQFGIVQAEIRQLSAEGMCRENFLRERAGLRQRMRKGEITDNAYGKLLQTLVKQHGEFECCINQRIDDFFKDVFPQVTNIDTKKGIVDVLEGRSSLFSE